MTAKKKEKDEGIRRMVEDIIVTPFFSRHTGHMPATIKLHAEITEEKNKVTLKSRLPEYEQEKIEVTASANTIDVTVRESDAPRKISEVKKHEDDILLHNSYSMPSPIDPDSLTVVFKDDELTVTAEKLGVKPRK